MPNWRAAVIGCGQPRLNGAEGYAIAHAHANGYQAQGVELVAAADINPDNLQRFVDRFGVKRGYADYRELLATERPDLVSVCTWVGLHPEMVIAAAEAGVRGILCEKPFALSLADTRRMLDACRAHNTQVALNTQRRFGEPWLTAKRLIAAGEIGRPLRFEGSCHGWDLLEWGSHWVDMARFFAGDGRAEWVLAQVDASQRLKRFAHWVENDAVISLGFTGGLRGLLFMGDHAPPATFNRIIGSEGLMELHMPDCPIRYIGPRTQGWVVPELAPGPEPFAASIAALIESFETGRDAPHGGENIWATQEIILAAYESAVQRRVIERPLAAQDFPLERLVAGYGESEKP
ncbi:MAG TPA: Gfo/Idh/MocA family oxidoreductase [Limnochordia bacterium]|nr:Gfo/Idh/MocA family oxidoreductase [Limnochordia bacterium]